MKKTLKKTGTLTRHAKPVVVPERYVIIRSAQAGCFAGILKSRNDSTVVLTDSRRLWYWTGAASLSELAQRGTSSPNTCKFPAPVTTHEILGVIEILDVTQAARESIASVKPWSQQ